MIQELPFNGIFGQGRSINANSGAIVNCYIEQMADGKAVVVGTPGLTKKFTLPSVPVRGCYSDSTISYWVAGNAVYKVDAAFTVTLLGTISTYSGAVEFASSGIHLMFVDGTNGWFITLSSGALTQITDLDFPNNAKSVEYLNGYFIVTATGTQKFYISENLNIATAWSALDFASAEGNPDVTVACKSYHQELVLFGYKTIEIWNYTGNVDFPFQRSTNAVIDQGCIAPNSIERLGDSLIWLGGDNVGSGIVWQLTGYQPQRISTIEIEQRLASYGYVGNAISMSYQQDGHLFYVLQFPSSNESLVYDLTTNLWHARQYKQPTTEVLSIWRPSCLCFNGADILAGDSENGNVYALDFANYTDDGAAIMRLYETRSSSSNQFGLFYNSVQIHMETGVGLVTGQGKDPVVMLRYSDDNGHTWGNWLFSTVGKIGQYSARAKYNRLGRGRNRVFQIKMTDPVKFVLLSMVLDYDQGAA